jgi:hypothetical protein
MTITVAERYKTRNFFTFPNTGIVGSIPFEVWISVYVYSVFVLSRVCSGLATGMIASARSPTNSL